MSAERKEETIDLIAWLEDLASAYRIEPSELTVRRYLRSLRQWRLEHTQWEQLSDRAVLRHSRFPSISELFEIAGELRREAEYRTNTERIESIRREWERKSGGAEGKVSEYRSPYP
ncbi:MAG: hypothetical protein JXA73_03320 [Acidobacteria bacterium]|nr:hypothetical protein [Acidobacteriota bacterium]